MKMDHPQNPNPNYSLGFMENLDPASSEFLLSDYLVLDDHHGFGDHDLSSQSMVSQEEFANGMSTGHNIGATSSNISKKCRKEMKKNKMEMGHRVAFRTKSEMEIMDDGFKWRKYGKKSVKNSPNPRNYYKCSSEGCNVKKRVERDGGDSRYVLTTYDGVHNHESPCVIYYNQAPLSVSSGAWTLQASSPHSSTSS